MPRLLKRTKKHNIRTNLVPSKNSIWKSKLIHLANKTFHLLFKLGDIFQLHPISTGDGGYKAKSGIQLAFHYVVLAVFVAIGMEKSWAKLEAFKCDGDEFSKAACLSVVTATVGSGIVASAVIIRPIETADLLNVSKFKTSRRFVNNVDAAIKMLLVSGAYLAAAVVIGAAGYVLDDLLPVQSYAFAIKIGLVREHTKSSTMKFGFGLVDFITIAAPPMATSALTINILIFGIARYKGMADELRLKNMSNLSQRSQMEREYITVAIHQSILSNWLTFLLPRAVLIFALSAVLNFYITFRMTQLPWFIYAVAPYAGTTEILALFALTFDGVCAVRAANEARGRLQGDSADFLWPMSRSMRVTVVKRAKALKPVGIPVGEFTELSFQVPVKVSEEIVNQLLLLLSF